MEIIISAISAFIFLLLWFAVWSKVNAIIENGQETNRLLTLLVHEQNRARRESQTESELPR